MYFRQDWLMRQIQMTVQLIAKAVFKKDSAQYEFADAERLSATDLLHNELKALIAQSKICEAENMLFENRSNSQEFLLLALDFYHTLNQMDDDELESSDFSREEIQEGLDEILREFTES